MAKRLWILFLLSMGLSPATAYVCNDDTSLPSDAFEDHGCLCGTNHTANLAVSSHLALYDTYIEAFAGCHEGENDDDDLTIECAFSRHDALSLKSILNRTSLSEIPVIPNGAQIYSKIRCL